MAWRSSLSYIFRIILLALIFMFIMSASSLVLGLADAGQSSADTVAAGQSLLGVSFLYSIVLSYPIIRSNWFGWPLILTIAVVLFGIMTFLSQIETVVFLKYLVDIVPVEVIPKLFLQVTINLLWTTATTRAARYSFCCVQKESKFRNKLKKPYRKRQKPLHGTQLKAFLSICSHKDIINSNAETNQEIQPKKDKSEYGCSYRLTPTTSVLNQVYVYSIYNVYVWQNGCYLVMEGS
jgi:hypothetical protein